MDILIHFDIPFLDFFNFIAWIKLCLQEKAE